MTSKQLPFNQLEQEKFDESRHIIQEALNHSQGRPLILQFSGGRDSMAMLGLTREITDNFFVLLYDNWH